MNLRGLESAHQRLSQLAWACPREPWRLRFHAPLPVSLKHLPDPPECWFDIRLVGPPFLATPPPQAVIVNAWNPGMQATTQQANERADRRLHAALQAAGKHPVRLCGCAARADHAEPGWLWPAAPCEGRRWARRFQQAGFYTLKHGLIEVVRTADGHSWRVGWWHKLWLNHAAWRAIAGKSRKKR